MKYLFLLIVFMCSTVFGQTYIKGPALIEGVAFIVSAGSSTDLTKDSQTNEIVTGITTQNVDLPSALTVPVGRRFYISNESTGIVTVRDFGENSLATLPPSTSITVRLAVAGGANGTWNLEDQDVNAWFLTGNSGTTAGTNFLGTLDAQALAFKTNNTEWMRILSTGQVGILTSTPTNTLSFGGDATRTISVERNTTTSGSNLNVLAGGALSGGTDLNGGTLSLRGGVSTGTGSSSIQFQTASAQTASSSTDNTPATRMTIAGTGNVGIGVGSPLGTLDISATRSGTPGSTGAQLEVRGIVFTDTGTAASGTAPSFSGTRFAIPTLNATNSNVTTTNAAIVTINGGVTAGTNQTITNSSSLRFNGNAISGTVTNSYQLMIAGVTSGATNNYAMSVTGNSGFGGMTDPMNPVGISAGSDVVGTGEQLALRSQRTAIVAGELIGGTIYRSNDTTLTAPGVVVSMIDAVASEAHTTTALGTDLVFYSTPATTATMAEKFRILGSGVLDTLYTAGVLQSDASGIISSAAVNLATSVTGILPSANGGTGVNNAGSLTYGANNITLTTTGVTSVTLPTTGTLATLAGSETLTNKTLTGNIAVNLVSGAATVTLPTTTSTLATLALTETLSNKTLASPDVTSGISMKNQAATIWYEQTVNGTNNIGITAPIDMVNASYSMTLPDGQGAAGDTLINNGSGTLTWGPPGQLYGNAIWPGTTNCVWGTTSGTIAAFAADSDCPDPTVTGSVSAPATKIPAIRLVNAAIGKYKVCSSFTMSQNGANSTAYTLSVTSGTVSSEAPPQVNPSVASGNRLPVNFCVSFTNASVQTIQVEIRAAAGAATTAEINNATSTFTQMVFNAERYQ